MLRVTFGGSVLLLALTAGCSAGKSPLLSTDSGGELGLTFQDGRAADQDGLLPFDGPPKPVGDGSPPTDTVPPVTTITCNGDCMDMVVSRMLLPDSNTQPLDLDGDGTGDNALGTILIALNSAVPSMTLQHDLDTSVFKGSALMLVRMQAASFADAKQALAQVWQGAEQVCCTATSDLAQCKAQATQTCFSGGHTFKPDPVSPNTSVMGGTVKSSLAAFGPARMTVTIPISSAATLKLDMVGVRLQGSLTSAGGIQKGVLAGAIPKSELDGQVVPILAQLLNKELSDPGTDPSTKNTIKTMFDADKNGSISAQEIKDNALVKTFLAGDVDVDGDGVKELSLGLELEAVKAVIDA
jgi:hypothetical protein